MARLVVGNNLSLLFIDQTVLLFQSGNNPFNGFLKFVGLDFIFAPSHSEKGGFVHKVRQVRTGKPRGHSSDFHQVYVLREVDVLDMNFQDFLKAFFCPACPRGEPPLEALPRGA